MNRGSAFESRPHAPGEGLRKLWKELSEQQAAVAAERDALDLQVRELNARRKFIEAALARLHGRGERGAGPYVAARTMVLNMTV